jgi:glycosyltransferase involved in cell wall biosynthesis
MEKEKIGEKNPRVSIILPTYNGAKYINRAIESVLSQTLSDWELLVINDGSTDETEEIIKEYIKKDNRIIYLKQENQGPAIARKNGIEKSKGEYIAFIDDDDVWIDKNKLNAQVDFLDENYEYVMVGTSGIIQYEKSDDYVNYRVLIKDEDIRRKMLSRCNFIQSSVMVKRSVLGDLSIVPIVKIGVPEDYLLWLRLGLIGKMKNLPQKMVVYTNRKGNLTDKKRGEILRNNIRIISQYKNNYPNYYKYVIFYIFKYYIYSTLNLIRNERLKNVILKPLLRIHRKIISE